MYMIEFSEDKVCSLYENIEHGLKYMGKAMQCVEELKNHEKKHEERSPRHYEEREYDYPYEDRGRGRYSRY